MRAPTVGRGKVRLRTYAAMGERDEHKSRSSPYAAHRSDASRGTAIDGCLLQLTCERRAARTLRASRWRAVVECTRPVHGFQPRPPLSPPSPIREGGNDIIPWWMLHPSGIAEYLARHDHVDETPSSSPRHDPAATQCAPAYMRLDVVCRVAFIPPSRYYADRRPYEKASTREWSVVDNMAYRRRFDESSRVDARWIYSEGVKSIFEKPWLRTFFSINRNINYV